MLVYIIVGALSIVLMPENRGTQDGSQPFDNSRVSPNSFFAPEFDAQMLDYTSGTVEHQKYSRNSIFQLSLHQ